MSLKKTRSPNLCPNDLCTGCASCFNICAHNAVSMKSDSEGFLSPVVDSKKCVGCGLCERACPILNPPKLEREQKPTTYACWNKDVSVRQESSSGGMFSVYAEHIIAKGGIVFGAVYDESMKVVLAKAETSAELVRLRSSKYVQAEVGTIYRDVKNELRSGRPVLFVGTPCQVGGLYGFLGKDYENLVTCDLVCHGTPSPALYEKWLKYLEKRLGGKVISLNMRGKQGNLSHLVLIVVDSRPNEPFIFQWGKDALVDYVGRMFICNICLRKSCVHCSFATFPRIGDITLGDYWGIGNEVPFERSTEGGVSLNLINSEKGARLVELCQKRAEYFERSLDEAKKGNPCLYCSSKPNSKRSAFLRDIQRLDYEELLQKYRTNLYGSFMSRIYHRIREYIKRLGRLIFSRNVDGQ